MARLTKRRLLIAALLLPALAACERKHGPDQGDLIITNSGDIATNAAIANKAEADGNEQPNNLAGLPPKAPASR